MSAPSKAVATVHMVLDLAPDQQEMAIAVLSDTAAYAFEEKRDGLHVYFFEDQYDEAVVRALLADYFPELKFTVEVMAAQDWNKAWEESVESVLVEDFVEVHPPFRTASPEVQIALQVMPRMAFGTGHHATTWMMLRACKDQDFRGKKVLDMGCGTAVLGMLAAKLGAQEVTAIDIDPWSEENALENAKLNGIDNMEVIIGDASSIPDTCYDFILANINRNVLLSDRDVYASHLAEGGRLLISGILDRDETMVTAHYLAGGFKVVARNSRNEWIMIGFTKENA